MIREYALSITKFKILATSLLANLTKLSLAVYSETLCPYLYFYCKHDHLLP